MNISILDLVLFQRHPEEMKRDTPEKYYEVQKYLSERENRSKFFKTIEELENDSSISSEDRSLENEFSEFWKKFQKDCLEVKPFEPVSLIEKFYKLFSVFHSRWIPVVSFLGALILIYNSTNLLVLVSSVDESVSFLGTQKSDLDFSLGVINSIYLFLHFSGTIRMVNLSKHSIKKIWTQALSILVLPGIYLSLEWGQFSELIVPNGFLVLYLLLSFYFVVQSFLFYPDKDQRKSG
ncbi:MAG: hypothetical protein H7A24_09870 [Leptospiraceae bacterium]|nr:hypothetical protein [Leptospiraceae bacterium]MCP5512176.1 hypothetical protein [Leptospiraceae bacterium]